MKKQLEQESNPEQKRITLIPGLATQKLTIPESSSLNPGAGKWPEKGGRDRLTRKDKTS